MSSKELDASVIDPSREVEELDVSSMKEDMYKLKQQMAEMYQSWSKGQPPPAYPTNPAFIPPLTQTQEHPTVDSSAGFPIYHHYQGTTSQTPQAPPPKPGPYPPPPITPIFIISPSATLHQSSSEPVFQAQDNQYYPPEPTFKALEVYTPRFDLPAEAEKPSENPEKEEMLRTLDMLRPIQSKLPNPPQKNLDYSVSCEYCSGTPGHDTKKFWHLKSAIQELIDTNRIKVQAPEAPNINRNPMLAH
uniref:Pollen-specific leucine-rich repeat extensin-like protein 2 n=1 Tax=Nicotiana tabacum TaxID=4097 RepID=A0A1S3ZHD1_TOBAC|nr:PREDICTED: pollen-specific leucine-rich repeat extensin-like protein 2 [Nicotiana tabacum]